MLQQRQKTSYRTHLAMTSKIPLYAAHHRDSDDSWQTLSAHLIGVGHWTRMFASKLGMGRLGELLGLLHDMGKYSQEFQAYLKSAVGLLNPDEDEEWVDARSLKGKVDHSTAGAQFIWLKLSDKKTPIAKVVGQLSALCVASHHSGLIDCIGTDSEDNFTRRITKADAATHLTEIQKSADPEIISRCTQLLNDPGLLDEVERVLKAIDQSHKTEGTTLPGFQQFGLLVRFAFSCLIAGDRIDTANFERPDEAHFRPGGKYSDWPVLIARIEHHLTTLPTPHPIDELRRDISHHCLQASSRANGIYTLSVPTGGGKTLASLRFALHHAQQRELDRIIYVIPFTSIIDQNAQVVRTILEPRDVPADSGRIVLEHHSNLAPETQTWREKLLCDDWDCPVVYTTMVQFLEALFGSGTRGARRMHQLANAVLVFDEVQTLPIRCVHLFNNAINFLAHHCNSTVVLCTATQPLLDHVDNKKGKILLANNHEIMPNVLALFEKLRRVHIRDSRRPCGWNDSEIATLVLDEVRREGSCLLIVNTKAAARRLFQVLRARFCGQFIHHLSTDMCPAHRKAELAALHARLKGDLSQPILCISTQLIEAGVDVDFRVVIRSVAGLDSIAQAAGRCNRNGSAERGTLHIIDPSGENLTMLPDIRLAGETAKRVLDNYANAPEQYRNDPIGPEALSEYYRYYFFARSAEMSYPLSSNAIGFSTSLLELVSTNASAVHEFKRRYQQAPNYWFRQAFMTAAKKFKAIDAPTESVVVPYGESGRELINDLFGSFDASLERNLLRKAQQYTVNVFPHIFQKLMNAGALSEVKSDLRIYCLDQRYYSTHFGISVDPVNPMETLLW